MKRRIPILGTGHPCHGVPGTTHQPLPTSASSIELLEPSRKDHYKRFSNGNVVLQRPSIHPSFTFPNPMPPLLEVFDRLLHAFGPQHWWPGNSPFEVMVGAILVQNTAWKNVERAINNLREENLLAPQPLYQLPVSELCELIRPTGYYRLKAGRLRNLLRLIVEEYNGDSMALLDSDLQTLREKLLSVQGIGPETADSILLYAAEKPSFVIDTYTHRVLVRHGWIGEDADYYQMKDLFELGLPQDVALYNEYHALLVRVGHLYCRRTPKCNQCPLSAMLPDSNW